MNKGFLVRGENANMDSALCCHKWVDWDEWVWLIIKVGEVVRLWEIGPLARLSLALASDRLCWWGASHPRLFLAPASSPGCGRAPPRPSTRRGFLSPSLCLPPWQQWYLLTWLLRCSQKWVTAKHVGASFLLRRVIQREGGREKNWLGSRQVPLIGRAGSSPFELFCKVFCVIKLAS